MYELMVVGGGPVGLAASVYAACRRNNVPRPLKEISKASTREHSEVSRSYRLLHRELKLKMPIDDPMKFVSGIASKLEVRPATELRMRPSLWPRSVATNCCFCMWWTLSS